MTDSEATQFWKTLQFNHRTSTFVLGDARIGPDTMPRDLASRIAGKLEAIEGHTGWDSFTSTEGPLALLVVFQNDVIHSGYFYCKIPGVADWSQAERVEAKGRRKHEAIMQRIFGTPAYQDTRVRVELLRDPRAFPEKISFTFAGKSS